MAFDITGFSGRLILAVIGIVVSALFLWGTTKVLAKPFSIKKAGFGTAFQIDTMISTPMPT